MVTEKPLANDWVETGSNKDVKLDTVQHTLRSNISVFLWFVLCKFVCVSVCGIERGGLEVETLSIDHTHTHFKSMRCTHTHTHKHISCIPSYFLFLSIHWPSVVVAAAAFAAAARYNSAKSLQMHLFSSCLFELWFAKGLRDALWLDFDWTQLYPYNTTDFIIKFSVKTPFQFLLHFRSLDFWLLYKKLNTRGDVDLFFKDTQVIFIILADKTIIPQWLLWFIFVQIYLHATLALVVLPLLSLTCVVAQELWDLGLGALVSTRGICIRMYILMWQNSSHYCAVFALHTSDHLPIKWFSADKAQSL